MPSEQKNFDLAVIGTVVVAVASSIASLQFDKGLAAACASVGAIITAIFGFLKARSADANARRVADISAQAALATNAKSVFVQSVTGERAVWRRELRDSTTLLVAMLRWSARRHGIDWQQVLRSCSELRLRLNPTGRDPAPGGPDPHQLDRDIHGLLDQILIIGARAQRDHQRLGDALEIAVAKLLKQEWDKSKQEAIDGKLA